MAGDHETSSYIFHIFSDEAGCFGFHKKGNASRYFIICSVMMENCAISQALEDLRRKIVWERSLIGDSFHACHDRQKIRNKVFSIMKNHEFDVHATIMEKPKARSHVRKSNHIFYKYGWYYQLKNAISAEKKRTRAFLFTTASIGKKKHQAQFTHAINHAVNEVAQQTIPDGRWKTSPSSSDPCLQIAEYCSWARSSKKMGTQRPTVLQSDQRPHQIGIRYEYDLWQYGKTHSYLRVSKAITEGKSSPPRNLNYRLE